MQIATFKVFCDLVSTSSFSRAAEMNGITQSAVSQQVRAIEERFDVRLIERGRRTVTLTREGRAFLDSSREILASYDDLENRLRKLKNRVDGELRIATIFSIGLHELPAYLKRFRRDHPDVSVQVEYRRSAQIHTAVQDGSADLGLLAYPAAHRGLRALTFWRDRLVLICAPGHRLARREAIGMDELNEEKFIAFDPDLPTRRQVDKKLKKAGVKVRYLFEFDNIETLKRAVAIENAISIVPETSVRAEVESGTLRSIAFDDPDMWRPLGALVRRTPAPSPALREFLLMLQNADHGGLAAGAAKNAVIDGITKKPANPGGIAN